MTELFIVIGMIVAFVVGAYVRAPFVLMQKNNEARMPQKETIETVEEKIKEKKLKQLENLLNYNGMKQGEDE